MRHAISVMLAAAALALALGGCHIKHTEEAVETKGELCFEVEPKDAVIIIDGTEIGKAKDYSERKGCIALERGRRLVRLEAEGYKTWTREYYVGTSSQSVKLRMIEE